MLVTGYHWTEHVSLRLSDLGGESSTLPLTGDLALSILERRCIGHQDGNEHRPCPTQRVLDSGRQCSRCQGADTFRPCMTCDGHRCPKLVRAARQNCRSIHHLYLADFGGPQLKVGTAADARRDRRLHDQGPIAALRVASGSGPKIKRLETFASTQVGLVEAFRRERKRALLRGSMTREQALDRLFDAWTDLQDAGPPHAELLHTPVEVHMPSLALRTRARISHQPDLPMRQGHGIRGEVVGAIGSVVLLQEAAGEVLVELGDLVGRRVDLDPPDDVPAPAMQLGLF